MKKIIALIGVAAVALTPAWSAAPKKGKAAHRARTEHRAPDWKIRKECKENPLKTGGIYYAYPVTRDSLAPVPAGFKPVYISHYGRHGSRWVTRGWLNDSTLAELDRQHAAGNLTPAGEAVRAIVARSAESVKGHLGELTRLGQQQHRGIAERMMNRFPELFAGDARVICRSSTNPRVIMSMVAFIDRMNEKNQKLRIERHASPKDMNFIAFHSADAKNLYVSPEHPFYARAAHICDSLYKGDRTAPKLFNDTARVPNRGKFMKNLYDIAVSLQGMPDVKGDMLQYFDPADGYDFYLAENYQDYVRQSNSVEGKSQGPASAQNLLSDILYRADQFAAGKRAAVDLRFGHDIFLMRVLALMQVVGADATVYGPEEAMAQWQSYNVSPMGANLQIILFRNDAGETIATVRLNERPVQVRDVANYPAPGYYRWDDLRNKWIGILQAASPRGRIDADGDSPVNN